MIKRGLHPNAPREVTLVDLSLLLRAKKRTIVQTLRALD